MEDDAGTGMYDTVCGQAEYRFIDHAPPDVINYAEKNSGYAM